MATGPVDVDPQEQRRRAIVDATGESSFPASDPPATWTWDPDGRPPRRSAAAVDTPAPASGED